MIKIFTGILSQIPISTIYITFIFRYANRWRGVRTARFYRSTGNVHMWKGGARERCSFRTGRDITVIPSAQNISGVTPRSRAHVTSSRIATVVGRVRQRVIREHFRICLATIKDPTISSTYIEAVASGHHQGGQKKNKGGA